MFFPNVMHLFFYNIKVQGILSVVSCCRTLL